MQQKLFIFGIGYTATRTAVQFAKEGFHIAGTVRSVASARRLHAINPQVFRLEGCSRNIFIFDDNWDPDANDQISVGTALEDVTHLLVSVPTAMDQDPVLSVFREEIVKETQRLLWVGYLSTIGVYGETNGIAVDECAPVQSSIPRCQARIRVEKMWLATLLPVHIFRIGGIYGPGRGPLMRVRSGSFTLIHLPGKVFNRIHVDDIVQVLLASATATKPGSIYNVCDDEPAPGDLVLAYACDLLGVSIPEPQSWEQAERNMSEMAKSFYAESKNVNNCKIHKELGIVLKYPTFREGMLAQLLEEEGVAGESTPVENRAIFTLTTQALVNIRQVSVRLSKRLQRYVRPCYLSPGRDTESFQDALLCSLKTIQRNHIQTPFDIVVLPIELEMGSGLRERIESDGGQCSEQLHCTAHPKIANGLIERDDRLAQLLAVHLRPFLSAEPSQCVIILEDCPLFDQGHLLLEQLRTLLPKELSILTFEMGETQSISQQLEERALQSVIFVSVWLDSVSIERSTGFLATVEEIKQAHPNIDCQIARINGNPSLGISFRTASSRCARVQLATLIIYYNLL
uniref:NADdependent epimerase/dehydratase putative n=1 Tax=Albugo laibachii Nc14 TaxID=890382 RepID=F0W5L8_9STRA|nr:NADdependent epimerase/dehydratase putative [Albugo laibachii Nc14]|eukprot:CCA16409.1 NADdependent epimerase/dehydratase putative [Albugo laibachii Nc14]